MIKSPARSRVHLLALYLVLILTPVLVADGLLHFIHGSNLPDLMPAGPDDVFYWHEPASFAQVGLSGGYTSPAEKEPPASFSRFGPWGPVTTVVYGAFALVSWPYYGVPLANLVMITASLGVLVALVRPTILQTLALIVIMATFSAMVIHGPTSMQVIFQLALAVSAAAGFADLVKYRSKTRLAVKVGLGILLLIMSLSKVTWAVLWIPYFVLLAEGVTVRSVILSFIVSGALAVFAAVFYRWTSAPYPYAIAQAQSGLGAAVDTLWQTLTANLGMFNVGHPLELHMRWLTVGLSVVMLGVIYRRRQRGVDQVNAVAGIVAFSLIVTLAATALLYEVKYFRDYRVLASLVLMGLILIVLTQRRSIVIAACLAQIVAVPWALDYYAESTQIHVSERIDRQVERWKPALAEFLVYDPDAPSPWCNTVLVSTPYIFDRVGLSIAIDERMSLALLTLEGNFDFPAKSAYILLDDPVLTHIGYQLRLEPLLDIPEGKLYRNLDRPCE